MRPAISCYAISASALLLFCASASAQQRASLDQTESLLKAGQIEQARTMLERWKKTNATAASSAEERARSGYLTARLTINAAVAEEAYMTVAISAPSYSPYVPESLLRVGQAKLLAGDAKNAASYLRRLVDNYPANEFAPLGTAWLARAMIRSGAAAGACTLVTNALRNIRLDAETAGLLRAEQTTACASTARADTGVRSEVVPAAVAPRQARFAIQVAAFREKSGARSVARKLENAGFDDVRLVTVPGSALLRVRVGSFANSTDAAAVMSKLKAAGYAPALVSDAQREQPVSN